MSMKDENRGQVQGKGLFVLNGRVFGNLKVSHASKEIADHIKANSGFDINQLSVRNKRNKENLDVNSINK